MKRSNNQMAAITGHASSSPRCFAKGNMRALFVAATICLLVVKQYQASPSSFLSMLSDNNNNNELVVVDTPPTTAHSDSVLLNVPFYVYDNLGLPQNLTRNDEPIQKPKYHKHADDAYLLTEEDGIYGHQTRYCWDCAPIVVESQRLVFFTIPKVACTTFKMLFRRMSGVENWNEPSVHDPLTNGLTYLHHYPLSEANEMMTSPNWTRAIFLRHPKARALSAYLDKLVGNEVYLTRRGCCWQSSLQTILQCDKEEPLDLPEGEALITYMEFLESVVVDCPKNPHWKSQYSRMGEKFWKYINFVGHFETVEADTRRLFQRLPDPEQAWEKYGATGWDFMVRSNPDNTTTTSASIFSSETSAHHSTNSGDRAAMYYSSPEVEARVRQIYRQDYEFALFNFSR